MAGGGSGGASSLAKAIESIPPADNRYVVAVFDHDQEGIKMFDGLSKNFKASAGHTYEKNHANGYAFAITLAVAGEELPTVSAKNLCVEYLFDNDDLGLKNEDGYGLQLKDQELFVGAGGHKLVLSAEQKLLCGGAVGGLSAYRIVSGGKKVFAEDIVPTLEYDKFYRFEGIFARIAKALRVDA